MAEKKYRLWVNTERTLLVRQWNTGEVEVAERDDPSQTWGPPVRRTVLPPWISNLTEESV